MKNVAISARACLLNHSRSAGESLWLSKHQIFSGKLLVCAFVATFGVWA